MADGKVGVYTEVEALTMEMDGARNVTKRVLVGEKEGAPNFIMRYFTVYPDGYTPHHSHPWEHENFIVRGRGKVIIGNKEYPVSAGSFAFVPPNVMHQYICVGDEPLELLCLIPKES